MLARTLQPAIVCAVLFFAHLAIALEPTRVEYQAGTRKLSALTIGNPELPALLMVHGSPGNAETTWQIIMRNPSLAERFHIIAVDRPGFGESYGAPQTHMDQQSESVYIALALNKSVLPATIVGYSYGGAIAVDIALKHPLKVGHLILIAPQLSPELEEPTWYERVGRRAPVRWVLPPYFRSYVIETYFVPRELRLIEPKLAEIGIPVDYIQGTKDQSVPIETADFARNAFKGTQLRETILLGHDHFFVRNFPNIVIEGLLKTTDPKNQSLRHAKNSIGSVINVKKRRKRHRHHVQK